MSILFTGWWCAVGAAAGFISLVDYIGRTTQENGIGYPAANFLRNLALYSIPAGSLLAILLIAFTKELHSGE